MFRRWRGPPGLGVWTASVDGPRHTQFEGLPSRGTYLSYAHMWRLLFKPLRGLLVPGVAKEVAIAELN